MRLTLFSRKKPYKSNFVGVLVGIFVGLQIVCCKGFRAKPYKPYIIIYI
jgi:hypothetical protein